MVASGNVIGPMFVGRELIGNGCASVLNTTGDNRSNFPLLKRRQEELTFVKTNMLGVVECEEAIFENKHALVL